MQKDSTKYNLKQKFVCFVLTSSVIGAILIFVALYNSSLELDLLNKINEISLLTETHIRDNPDSKDIGISADLQKWWKSHSSDPVGVFRMSGSKITGYNSEIIFAENPITPELIKNSKKNELGGYWKNDNSYLVWASLAANSSVDRIIVVNEYTANKATSIVTMYIKKLIAPIIFYIWALFWVSSMMGNITDKIKIKKEEMEYLALHDTLTNLPNRNLLSDRLDNLFRMSKRNNISFAVVMIDLDKFKDINDSMGHEAGDQMLKIVATRLAHVKRDSDTVARMGGDEFILLLPDVNRNSWPLICKRIQEAFSESCEIMDQQIKINFSIGAAMYPQDGVNEKQLLLKADSEMYKDKQNNQHANLHTYAYKDWDRKSQIM